MPKQKRLTKKQLSTIDEIFEGRLEINAILAKHRVSRSRYDEWLADPEFAAEFDRRIQWLARHSQVLIARYAPLAAAKLVQLTESEKEETARKACLDIISLPNITSQTEKPPEPDSNQPHSPKLTPETAGKILALLAGETS